MKIFNENPTAAIFRKIQPNPPCYLRLLRLVRITSLIMVLCHSDKNHSEYFTPSLHQLQRSVIISGLVNLWLGLPSFRFGSLKGSLEFSLGSSLDTEKSFSAKRYFAAELLCTENVT